MLRGIEPLVDLVETAIDLGDVEATVDHIKSHLCRMIRTQSLEIPAQVLKPVDGHYARRLLQRDLERDYSIVAMTWGPCQATGIHDHAGMWCVEGVWAGSINVEQYELTAIDANSNRFRFEKRNSYEAGVGSAGCLIPPYEYHLIGNPCDRSPAVSIHIYGGEMTSCHVFEDHGNGWYERSERALGYDQ
ncbi:MAG: cysteine dioxygenase family protein [Pseudomonadota bacterium]